MGNTDAGNNTSRTFIPRYVIFGNLENLECQLGDLREYAQEPRTTTLHPSHSLIAGLLTSGPFSLLPAIFSLSELSCACHGQENEPSWYLDACGPMRSVVELTVYVLEVDCAVNVRVNGGSGIESWRERTLVPLARFW